MRPQLPEHTLVTLLRQCFIIPRCQGLHQSRSLRLALGSHHSSSSYGARCLGGPTVAQQRGIHTRNDPTGPLQLVSSPIDHTSSPGSIRQYSSTADQPPQSAPNIAILGAGITGLASAHYLTKEFPHANITIYEGNNRIGGWVQSTTVETDEGDIVFEQGPRSLRPSTAASLVTMEMIQDLGLEDEILITPNTSPAASNRFIYYPDRLVKMPGPGGDPYAMAWTILTDRVFEGLLWGAFREYSNPGRDSSLEDESIGHFLERRLGTSKPGDNIVSAVFHGIYAGDIYKLSAKSLLPSLWDEEGQYGSIAKAKVATGRSGETRMQLKDVLLKEEMASIISAELMYKLADASVYTLKGGLATFSNALEASLKANPKVKFEMRKVITSIKYDAESETVLVKAMGKEESPEKYTHCISTLRPLYLSITTPRVKTLSLIQYVTVMVVNLFYRDQFLLSEPGFGYLIPRSIPFEQNPERALGVVYDTFSSVGQDKAAGTKLTVMLGGHWWDDFTHYPSSEEGVDMAKAVLKRHLNIDIEPDKTLATFQRNCIPQYTVGHEQNLASIHSELMRGFKGKLSVAGSWIDGVGLNDCVRGARDLVMKLKGGSKMGHTLDNVTGLEEFQKPRKWAQTKAGKVVG